MRRANSQACESARSIKRLACAIAMRSDCVAVGNERRFIVGSPGRLGLSATLQHKSGRFISMMYPRYRLCFCFCLIASIRIHAAAG